VETKQAVKVVKTEEPPKRLAGIKVGSPAELVAKLKEAGAL
jgi:electron transfer flavoprotein beta subunit